MLTENCDISFSHHISLVPAVNLVTVCHLELNLAWD